MNVKGEGLHTGTKLSRSRPVSPKGAGSWALEFINLFGGEKKPYSRCNWWSVSQSWVTVYDGSASLSFVPTQRHICGT